MSAPLIVPKRPIFSASAVLTAIGSELSLIKSQDNMTWDDIARVLGKSPDQAGKYAQGTAEMGVVAFGAAKREWNGRFTGAFDRLCVESRPGVGDDRSHASAVLKAALALTQALEAGAKIDPSDVRNNRKTFESARDALDAVLDTLAPRSVAP